MPNHKSAEKRVRSSLRKRARNRYYKGLVKAALKNAREAIQSGTNIEEKLRTAQKLLSSAARKGIIHRNKAARLISRLTIQARKEQANAA
jgi:small subunit ribosomal protein S20